MVHSRQDSGSFSFSRGTLPRVNTAQDALNLQQPSWVAMPDEDDAAASKAKEEAEAVMSPLWWFVSTAALGAALLMFADSSHVPWWLLALLAAEGYAFLRRVLVTTVKPKRARPAARLRRLRHFTSMKLKPGAPADEMVAMFLAVDAMAEVKSVELGANRSTENSSREHSLGFLVTFGSEPAREKYLASTERAEFISFCDRHVDEWFVFDFESGSV